MAKQTGILQVSGNLGNINFYQAAGGSYARRKTSLDRERVLTDPQFERTRENFTEFGMASRAAGLFRRTFLGQVKELKDKAYRKRVTQLMLRIKELDMISGRGKRTVEQALSDPNTLLLFKELDFNQRSSLRGVLLRGLNLNTLTDTITFADFVPQTDLVCPSAATHVQLTAYRADFDFGSHVGQIVKDESLMLALDDTVHQIELTPGGEGLSAGIRLLVLRIQLFQEINGKTYSLKGGDFGVMEVVGMRYL
jgi:hypothetical protein